MNSNASVMRSALLSLEKKRILVFNEIILVFNRPFEVASETYWQTLRLGRLCYKVALTTDSISCDQSHKILLNYQIVYVMGSICDKGQTAPQARCKSPTYNVLRKRSKTTSLIRYKRGINNNIMQCKRYPPPLKLRSRLQYFNIWNNKLYGILKLISFRLLRFFLTFVFFWLFFAASRLFLPHAKKNQEKPLGPGYSSSLWLKKSGD